MGRIVPMEPASTIRPFAASPWLSEPGRPA